LVVELGFDGLVICVLDKKLGKIMRSTIDGPWRPPPSYGRYGSTPSGNKARNNQLTSYATGSTLLKLEKKYLLLVILL
jgi:hypothetical protein